MADWDENSPQLQANLQTVLTGIVRAASIREVPSRKLARMWQHLIMNGVELPDYHYRGAFRGERHLEKVHVLIGPYEGVVPSLVHEALSLFEERLQAYITALDSLMLVGQEPDEDQLAAIIDVCAWAHAEWIRIHPFANGNGRTARLWANWVAVRYGLPPFVTLRPRPGHGYGNAGAEAMRGNWIPTVKVFRDLLNAFGS